MEQTIGLGVIRFNLDANNLKIGTIGSGDGVARELFWGGNLGLGLQIPIGEHAALVLEGRGFYFPKRTLEWEPVVDRPLSAIEQVLLARVQERCRPSSSSRGGCRPRRVSRSASERAVRAPPGAARDMTAARRPA